MSAKRAVVLEHDPKEGPGTLARFMASRRIPFDRVALYRGEPLPPVETAGVLIVMGGPMNVYEEDKFPFLAAENAFIRSAIQRKIPYLGLCLGSQLLAKAFGARVYKARVPEVGWCPVQLSAEARRAGLFQGFDESLEVLQWHEDTFDLPERSVHLASSPEVPHQAFQVDGIFYGLQFHLEVDEPILKSWFERDPRLAAILAEYARYQKNLDALAEKFFGRFFELTGKKERVPS